MNHGVVILLSNQQPPAEGMVGKEGGGEGVGRGWIRKGRVERNSLQGEAARWIVKFQQCQPNR